MKCDRCDGKGWEWVSLGDEAEKDVCCQCDGTGGKICDNCGELNDSGTSAVYCEECERTINQDVEVDRQLTEERIEK